MTNKQDYLFRIRVDVGKDKFPSEISKDQINPSIENHNCFRSNIWLGFPPYDLNTVKGLSKEYPPYLDLKGAIHLYRSTKRRSDMSNDLKHEPLALVLCIPSSMKHTEFIDKFDYVRDSIAAVYYFRADNFGDSSAVVKLKDIKDAENFTSTFRFMKFVHGLRKFAYIYLLQEVEFMNSSSMTSMPSPGYRELPYCNRTLELLNASTSMIYKEVCKHNIKYCSCDFQPNCNLCQYVKKSWRLDTNCLVCGEPATRVCLICSSSFCGSFQEGHARDHSYKFCHIYSMELQTNNIDYFEENPVNRNDEFRTAECGDEIQDEPGSQRSSAAAEDAEDLVEGLNNESAVPDNTETRSQSPSARNSSNESPEQKISGKKIKNARVATKRIPEQELIVKVAEVLNLSYFEHLRESFDCYKKLAKIKEEKSKVKADIGKLYADIEALENECRAAMRIG